MGKNRTNYDISKHIFRRDAAAREVNHHWRGFFPLYGEGQFGEERPWFMYRELGSSETRLYDVVRDTVHQRTVWALEGARFLGSNLGWVVMVDGVEEDIRPYRHIPQREHNLFLYNPFTSERYQLPTLTVNNLRCVLRYGVITGDPHQENLYGCVIADIFVQENRKLRMRHPPSSYWEIYYTAKRNGQWERY